MPFAERIRTRFKHDEFGDLRLTIPAPRRWGMILFMAVWLCGWAVGEVAVSGSLLAGLRGQKLPKLAPFLFVWLAFWTVGGAHTFLTLLWHVIGREVVTFGKGTVEMRVEVGWFRRSRWLDLGEASNLRYSPDANGSNQGYLLPISFLGRVDSGSIALDGPEGTYRFGHGLTEYEAHRVIATIERRFKIPGPHPWVFEPLPTSW